MKARKKPVIIFGPPRSGTTWLANVLSANGNINYIHEPDNEKNNFLAYVRKNKLNRFPYLREDDSEKHFVQLFRTSLYGKPIRNESKLNVMLMRVAGINKETIENEIQNNSKKGPRIRVAELLSQLKSLQVTSGKRRIIKSVHAHLSIPFLQKHLDFIPLIIVRHPASVIASHIKLQMPDANREIFNDERIKKDFLLPYLTKIEKLNTDLEYFALQISIFHHVLSKYIKNNSLEFITHEDLCMNPLEKFKSMYQKLKLEWNYKAEQFIDSHNQSGKDAYDIYRNCDELNQKWKKTFTKSETRQIEKAYTILPNDFNYTF